MGLKNFFSELKRRKVYGVAISYGITAWVLAQITELVTSSFETPPWVENDNYSPHNWLTNSGNSCMGL